MNISDHGLDLLGQWEGVCAKAYKDSAGYWSIGIGHKITPSELQSGAIVIDGVKIGWHTPLTQDQIDTLCRQDLLPVTSTINTVVASALSQNEFDAMAIFAFNIGTGGFRSSTVLKDINSGDLADVPDAMRMWTKITVEVNGQPVHKVDQGLVNRRENEIKLWLGVK